MLYQGKKERQKAVATAASSKRPGETGMVLQGLELRLGEGVVVADLGAAERAGHPEVGEQLRGALAGHRRAADALMFVKGSLGVFPLCASSPVMNPIGSPAEGGSPVDLWTSPADRREPFGTCGQDRGQRWRVAHRLARTLAPLAHNVHRTINHE